MMKRTTSLPLFAFLLFLQTLNAQGDFPCATDFAQQQAFQNAVLFQKHQSLEQQAYDFFSQQAVAERGSQVLTVPVVVHIVHDNGPENLSDAQVQQAIAWLNQAFANQGVFDQGSGADVGIQFCLAQRTPDGQPTNGITRDQNSLTEFNLESEQLAMKNINRWQPTGYINIWVVRDICSVSYGCGIVAYAYYPSSHGSNLDGIVVEANVINSLGNVSGLVHEMGHYFGLYHSFEGGCTNNDCLSDGDRVCDTPPDQSTAAVPCNQSVNTCSTDAQSGFASDQPDMTLNHMDYGHLNCKHDFTEGQADRMNFFLDGARKSLLESKGCLPPCPLPVLADFTPGDTTILAGQTVFFDNNSQNAVNFSWSLNGVPFGNQQNAAYLFDSAGVFTVQLVAQPLNGQLCGAASAQATVQVTCPAVANFTLSNTSPEEGQPVFVTNASQNATQFEWFVNGVSQGAVLDSIVFGEAGVYEIRLVAKGSFCSGIATETVFVRDSCKSKTWIYSYSFGGSTGNPLGIFLSQTVLADGNLLAAYRIGQETPSGTLAKILLVKTKPDGNVVWAKIVGNTASTAAYCVLAASPDGGLAAVIGQYDLSSELFDIYAVKISPDGVIEWSQLLKNDSDIALLYKDILVNPAGEIVIDEKIKFDLNGNLIWSKTHSNLVVDKTAVMPDGNFVSVGSLNFNSFNLARFDSNGDVVWTQEFTSDYIQALDVAIAPDGNIFVLGTRPYVNLVASHTVLLKFTPDGELVWSRRYFHKNVYPFSPTSFALDENGIVVIAHSGIKTTQTTVSDARAMLRVDYDGSVVWVRHFLDYYFSGAQLSTLTDGFFCVSGNTWLKIDPLGFAGECQNEIRDVSYEDLSLTPSPLAVDVLRGPTDFPPAFLPIAEAELQSDTLCAPACPRGVELCNNNLDDDLDGLFDCLDPDCNCPMDVCAPGEAKIWYFGNHAGLDFNTEPPTVLTDGQTMNALGSAVMCDAAGNLLFYSDGKKVYNRFHEPMPNGNDLDPIPGVPAYEVIALPYPGKPDLYYLVTVGGAGPGWYFSLLDMKLDGGKGDVVAGAKSVQVGNNYSVRNKLTAVRSCAFDGYWLILREQSPDNVLLAFRVDENGLNLSPVISPSAITTLFDIGRMKCSPDGRKLATTRGAINGPLELYNFNPVNGVISGERVLQFPGIRLFGIEFSPSGRYLYISTEDFFSNKTKIIQLNIEAGDSSQIMESLQVVASRPSSSLSDKNYGVLQLAPNGKIYVTDTYGSASPILHVIHQPDLPAPACQFQENGLTLTGTNGASTGLVNIPQNLFAEPAISFSQNAPDTICNLDSTYAYVAEKSGCFQTDSILWKMEGLSGTLNHDDENGWIKFDTPGSGRLIVTAHTECGIVADTLPIVVAEPFDKTLDLGSDQVVCDNDVFTFNAGSGFARYRWQNGSPDSVLTTLLPGKYWVDVWDACGNRQTDTVTVSIAPATVLDLGPDQAGCPDLSATFQRPGFFTSWQWSPAGFTSCDTCSLVTVAPSATVSWTVVAQTDDGCISVDSLTFQIQDTLFFQRDTSVCRGQTIDLFGTTLPADTTAHFFFQNPGLGCDTLLTVNVLGLDAPFLEIEKTICANTFFTFNGIALPADTTAVFLLPGMSGECDSVVTVTVNAWPPLAVTLPSDTTLRIGATLILNAETTGTEPLIFAWSPVGELSCSDCPDPEISPLETMLYTLQVSDANGCSASDSILVTVENVCTVIIPNAFTPNDDGVNDFFYPRTDPCVRLVRTWRVVSRWGETVFEKNNFEPNNPGSGWNGNRSNGEPFPSDVLVWYAELEYFDGKKEVRKGDVALLR